MELERLVGAVRSIALCGQHKHTLYLCALHD